MQSGDAERFLMNQRTLAARLKSREKPTGNISWWSIVRQQAAQDLASKGVIAQRGYDRKAMPILCGLSKHPAFHTPRHHNLPHITIFPLPNRLPTPIKPQLNIIPTPLPLTTRTHLIRTMRSMMHTNRLIIQELFPLINRKL